MIKGFESSEMSSKAPSIRFIYHSAAVKREDEACIHRQCSFVDDVYLSLGVEF